jgi:secreted PhoX family phosphatase
MRGPERPTNPNLWDVADARLSRRGAMKGMLALAASTGLPSWLQQARGAVNPASSHRADQASSLTFTEIELKVTHDHRVAHGYRADVLMRWGDPLWSDAPAFDHRQLIAADHARQFGYNCDFIAYMPLPRDSNASDHGLLCVNHEYTNPHLMWTGLAERDRLKLDRAQSEYELAAHGHSVMEIRRERGQWMIVRDSLFTRRISGSSPIMRVSGPAAGHDRLKTKADPTGTRIAGTLNNCAGGVTPWGTVLIAEENFNKYFGGASPANEDRNYRRLYIGPGTLEYGWHRHFERFNMDQEPHEANRFGWIVEFDPYDPNSIPVKRSALGRCKHEGAAVILNRDGRVVLYTGDDERNEYVYRFVTEGRFDPNDRESNRDLLDRGTLSAAKFHADGTLTWLPLRFGEGPLTPANDFHSQADVLIECRRAADLIGATPMDRPEDIEPNPITGSVFVMLTNNPKRSGEKVDAANPRAGNRFGHIVELIPPDGAGANADHAADTFRWNIFVLAGDPQKAEHAAVYHPGVSRNGWLMCPDNAAIDHKGRLWIATDNGGLQRSEGVPDGLWATDVSGDGRALTKLFYAVPSGAEMCGPCFTPDGRTLFASVQHPGEDPGSTFDNPSTRWPDFQDGAPPRPAVVAITREDGGEIGT